MLADEPTAHLDHIQVEGVLQLLRELASPGRVVIVSTHDDRVTHLADRVVELQPNLASADRPPEELHFEPGELIFEQGSRGDLVYVVEAGEVEIFRTRSDGTEEPLATVVAGELLRGAGPHAEPAAQRVGPRRAPPRTLTSYTVRHFRRRLPEAPTARPTPDRGYSKSIEAKRLSLVSWWRAFTRRTVPDFERITSDWVVAPRLS